MTAEDRATLSEAGSRQATARPYVNPVIPGIGTPFLPRLDDRVGLKLLETRTFGSGVTYLRYGVLRPAG